MHRMGEHRRGPSPSHERVILSRVTQAHSPLTCQPTILSAPFGNYIQPAGVTATLGTFTAQARGGRLWQILKTVRYYRRLGAWVNKMGLRNPGMTWLVDKVAAGKVDVRDKLVSIHGFTPEDWQQLLKQVTQIAPLGVELNMSCPNVGAIHWPKTLFADAMATGVPVVVKLPPIRYEQMVEQALAAQVKVFHCCNTLPVAGGGMSGRPLKPLALQCLQAIRQQPGADQLTLIGGGGIFAPADVDDYVAAGANHVALGTVAMDPRLLWTHKPIEPLIDHARLKLTQAVTG